MHVVSDFGADAHVVSEEGGAQAQFADQIGSGGARLRIGLLEHLQKGAVGDWAEHLARCHGAAQGTQEIHHHPRRVVTRCIPQTDPESQVQVHSLAGHQAVAEGMDASAPMLLQADFG